MHTETSMVEVGDTVSVDYGAEAPPRIGTLIRIFEGLALIDHGPRTSPNDRDRRWYSLNRIERA